MFRAYDAQRERLVAVKVFSLGLPPDQAHRLVAEFERLIAADLTHPSMATPLATGITGVSAYLAQEYVSAESLDLTLRQYGPAPPADALRIAAQLAGALDFAAVADVSHGALHPRDVLTSSDETRLTGVGVARALEQIGVAAPVRRPYTAPERIAGAAWGRRADLFSLGALMYEVLWGRRLSGAGASALDELTDIAGADLEALRAAFGRALAEDPADRFDSALEFAESLKAAFPGVTLTAPAPPKRRKPRVTAALPAQAPTLPLEEPTLPLDAPPSPDLPLVIAAPPLELATPAVPDVDLAVAVETPAVPLIREPLRPTAPVPEPEPAPVPVGLIAGQTEPLTMIDRSRSAVWPLGLALGVGLAIGFAGGYGVGTRERVPPPVVQTVAGRDFTERAIAEPTKVEELPKAPVATPAATAPPRPTVARRTGPGQLQVRSTPSAARVSVDGVDSGRTPVTVRELSTGAHRIEVTHEGFAPAERRVTITRARPTHLVAVTLDAAPATTASAAAEGRGVIRVESRPAGASVYVDGRMVGTTPLSQAVAVGEHGVRLELAGYRGWTSSIRVVASETGRVTASLER